MRKIVIIGNGFDLSLGLKTSYRDFILHFYKAIIFKTLREGSANVQKTVISIDGYGIKKTGTQKIDEALINGLFNYKYEIDSSETITEIRKLLERFNLAIDADSLFDEMINKSLWCDIEFSYYKRLKSEFLRNKNSAVFHATRMNKLFDYIIMELNSYIENEQQRTSELLKAKNHYQSLFDKINDGANNPERDDRIIINFNYTDSVNLCLAEYDKRKMFTQVIPIHGSVTDTNNPIIFGYGDDLDSMYPEIEESNEYELVRHMKAFNYSLNDNYHKILASLEHEFEVHIVGHSCGLSDRTLLRTIFEHDNCKGIYNYHYQTGENAKMSHFQKSINVARLFEDKVKQRERFMPFNPDLKY